MLVYCGARADFFVSDCDLRSERESGNAKCRRDDKVHVQHNMGGSSSRAVELLWQRAEDGEKRVKL